MERKIDDMNSSNRGISELRVRWRCQQLPNGQIKPRRHSVEDLGRGRKLSGEDSGGKLQFSLDRFISFRMISESNLSVKRTRAVYGVRTLVEVVDILDAPASK